MELLTCIAILLLSLGSRAQIAGSVYQYFGNPYELGPLNVTHVALGKHFETNPEHVSVYYPVAAGTYAPVVFVPGLYGLIFAEWYSDVLSMLASHGLVVVGVDLFWPAVSSNPTTGNDTTTSPIDTSIDEEPEFMYRVLQWLVSHLNQEVLSDHGVVAQWTLLGLGGHSAGCDTVLKMVQHNRTLAKAIAFMEPFSYYFNEPLGYSLPSLSYGTQYSEESPKCVYPEWDYVHFYGNLQCPKIIMNVTGFGHCDILNEINWETCRVLHFCKTNKNNDRKFYHTFVSGVLTSFFGTYLQGSSSLLKFITQRSLIPTPLGLFNTDTTC